MQQVTFPSNELSIHGTLALPRVEKQPFPAVIIFHGMTSSEKSHAPLASSLAEIGIAGLAVSMRGHGESEGDFNKATVAEAVSDGTAAYDFIAAQTGVDINRIGIVGSSVGAIIAAMTSERRSVRSLVFRAPAAYTRDMMQLSMAEVMTNEARQFHEIDNLGDTPAGNAIANFTGSLLIVASGEDAIIPMSVSEGYVSVANRSNNKQLVVIEGAGHALTEPAWRETFSYATLDWFTRTLIDII